MSRFGMPIKSLALYVGLFIVAATFLGCLTETATVPASIPDGAVLNPDFVRVLPPSSKDQPGPAVRASSSAVISASEGGVLSCGTVWLIFPPGALSQDTAITVTMSASDDLQCDLSPDGIHFNAPVTLRFDLAGTTAAGLASETSTVWYNPESGYWEIIPQLPVTDPNVTESLLEHFSQYGKING